MSAKPQSQPAPNSTALYFSERLWRGLAPLRERPLTVIAAPMGYGKTTAAREYLRENGIRAVWTQVPGGSLDVFWRDFCRGIGQSFPEAGETAASLRRLGYPHDSARVDMARELLQNLVCPVRTLLVIDDFHRLADQGAAGMGMLCEALAGQGEGNLGAALISRDAYNGSRELLEVKGLLTVVGQEVLALRAGEIREYYRLYGVNLTKGEAETLCENTSGWISALYLHLLRYLKTGKISPPADLLAMVDREVYAPLPPAAKELALALYPLESFTLEQAVFLAGEEAGEGLAELSRKNPFIRYDAEEKLYLPHSLVRQCMRQHFEQLPRKRRLAIRRRCSEWFATRGDTTAAIALYREAGDYETALQTLDKDPSRTLVTGKARFFMDFFQECPAELLEKYPAAVFKYAIAAFSCGDFAAFVRQLAWLGGYCESGAENDARMDGWRGELELLRSLAAYNDIAAMSRHHRLANKLLDRPTRLFTPESPWTLGSPSVLFMFHRESGKLAEEIRLMHECMPHYYRLAAGHGAGGEHLMEAEALYQAGRFVEAAIAVRRAEAMAADANQVGNIICAMFIRLRLALMAGDFGAADKLARDMRNLVKDKRDYFYLHSADLCQGYLYAAVNRPVQAPEWLGLGRDGEKRLYNFAGGFYYLVHGEILMAEERWTELPGLFSWLLESGAFGKNLLFAIYAHIFNAAARRKLGAEGEAAKELGIALTLALPDDILMPFAENWRHIESIGLPAPSGYPDSGLIRLRALAAAWEKRRRGILARHFSGAEAPLTARELEMARLAASGKKYREIAETTYLAPSTVKKAFVTIYNKLGISSRKELLGWLEGVTDPENKTPPKTPPTNIQSRLKLKRHIL
ncbi:MAG: LuxR C-terminal-related transcriptional regulator [Planctomycetota bacterium]|jgi:LuxR family maltose regulon positive regulatory protein|nr:LuxR C-terminal-related transcriptional regulator [Planctomycetota bacterium]